MGIDTELALDWSWKGWPLTHFLNS